LGAQLTCLQYEVEHLIPGNGVPKSD